MISVEQAKTKFQGVVVPIATIFNKDGSLDLGGLAANIQWLIDQGAKQGNTVLLAAGSGGDFTVMSTEERKQVIQTISKVNDGKLPTMAGVQSTDIRETIELCQHCEDVGVDAAQISGAYYYDCRPDDVLEWHKEVARHTNVAFVAYSHWYSGSKYDLPIELVDRLLDIPNTVAVKWGSPSNDNYYRGVLRFMSRAAVIDNTLQAVWGHALGCRAWISHVPNFFPQLPWRVWDLMQERRYEEAQKLYDGFMIPYSDLVGKVAQSTAGEGVFVRPGLKAAGLSAGFSRLPSRDDAATPEVQEGFRNLLSQCKSSD